MVKESLGDLNYDTYFTDAADVPGGRQADLLEFIHYNIIFFDEQINHPTAYRASKEAHVYSLLRRLTVGLERSEAIGL